MFKITRKDSEWRQLKQIRAWYVHPLFNCVNCHTILLNNYQPTVVAKSYLAVSKHNHILSHSATSTIPRRVPVSTRPIVSTARAVLYTFNSPTKRADDIRSIGSGWLRRPPTVWHYLNKAGPTHRCARLAFHCHRLYPTTGESWQYPDMVPSPEQTSQTN